ncbi:MAG: hypothetical protein ABSD88_11660, partial [Candidatus Korobacteraceae bacterium]
MLYLANVLSFWWKPTPSGVGIRALDMMRLYRLRKNSNAPSFLKGRGFSRAVTALYFQYPERASAREGSAF